MVDPLVRSQQQGRIRRARPVVHVAVALVLCVARPATVWAIGNQYTTCAHLCPGTPTPDPCVVAQTVNVLPGSVIDCGTSAVHVTGGDLLVHDARFVLKARAVFVSNRTIVADCPASSAVQGFELRTTDYISVGQGGKLLASCDAGGGRIALVASGAITVAGLGIQAKGTAPGADGGLIAIRSGAAVATYAALDASTTATSGDPAAGGGVHIVGTAIAIGENVTAAGYQAPSGQGITLEASGAISVDGILDAGTASGDGGMITISAGGALTTSRPIKVRGVGSTRGGGTIALEGETITIGDELVAEGGTAGGRIGLRARTTLLVQSPSHLNAAVGNPPGSGGEISVQSEGGDVTIAGSATLEAEGGGQGRGGMIEIEGVGVTAASSSSIEADGGSGQGGSISVSARGALVLNGAVHAINGDVELTYRCTETPCEIPPVLSGGLTAAPEASMDAPCGDDVLRPASSEQCDGRDLGGATCASTGHGTGTLACSSTCGFDFGGCSN